MATQTPNYNFDKPVEGGDNDVWGTFLNGNWDSVDTLLKSLQDQIEALKIPVGGIYMSGSGEDPSTALGYGTWVPKAEGRAIVGVGNNGQSEWVNDELRGAETHQLTTAEMPIHAHTINPPQTTSTSASVDAQWNDVLTVGDTGVGGDGYKIFQFANNIASGTGGANVQALGVSNNHTHVVDIQQFSSDVKGGGEGHNIVQPSIAVYIWQRTA